MLGMQMLLLALSQWAHCRGEHTRAASCGGIIERVRESCVGNSSEASTQYAAIQQFVCCSSAVGPIEVRASD